MRWYAFIYEEKRKIIKYFSGKEKTKIRVVFRHAVKTHFKIKNENFLEVKMTLNKNKNIYKKISISLFTVDVLILYYHQFYFFSTIVYLSHNVVKVVKKRRTKKLSIWYPEQFCVSWNCFGCKDTTRIYIFFCVYIYKIWEKERKNRTLKKIVW